MTRVLFNENFAGLADGAAPPSSISKVDLRGAWSMDIQGEALSVRGSASTSPLTQLAFTQKVTPDAEFSGRVKLVDNAADLPRIAFVHKCDGLRNQTVGSSGLFYNGWNVSFFSTSVQFVSYEGATGTGTSAGGGQRLIIEHRFPASWNATTDWVKFRIQFLVDRILYKFWRDGDAEPSDWHEVSDSFIGGDYMPYMSALLGYVTKGNSSADPCDWRLDDFKVQNIGKQLVHVGGEVYEPGHFRRHIGGEVYKFERPRVLRGSGLWLPLGVWSDTHLTPQLRAGARVFNGSALTLNLSIPTTFILPGDTLMAFTLMVSSTEASIVPPPAVNGVSWTKAGTVTSGTNHYHVWTRVVQPGETGTYIWTGDINTLQSGELYCYRNLDGLDQVVASPIDGAAGITYDLTPLAPTAQAESLIVACAMIQSNIGTNGQWTGGPYTYLIGPGANQRVWTGHRLVKAIGSYGATAVWSTSRAGRFGFMTAWKAKAR